MDEDPSNNDITNLRAMHHACHVAHHNGKRFVSAASRQRMSAAQKRRRAEESAEVRGKFTFSGRKHSSESVAKISAAKQGHEVAPETREKLAQAARGNTNMLGRSVSEETKRKIAESLRGKPKSAQARANIAAANRRRAEKERGG